ncbi:DUF302 domain-containing protein [Winogradskyella thalassocola]|uniref:Uncharacterized conserved protein, DUF302 family n=1 Tax=Winogradskyella thalassocola TaxID=262004 RepID=A0A1G8E1D9_9FLAO|nr:DUF302 domain-containing protein [Winogradskyella thalassocola]SDH63688.1 Uncharacterized conserved protein, DUF302 family [Winogradskyella thalassocola]
MKIFKFSSILFSTLLLVSACKDDVKSNLNNTPNTEGIGYVETDASPSGIYDNIVSQLNSNENIGIIAEVNHSENAQNVGLELDFTRTVYFGNPTLGTPLMQNNSSAGLDLPQRLTVFTDEIGDAIVAYNSVDYLVNRHSLSDVSTTDMIANALVTIVNSATEKDIVLNSSSPILNDGIISVTSTNDFNTTYNLILDTLNSLDAVSVIAELDHQANAQSVAMELLPTKLIIFGNPALGTPLMSELRTIALDLPQKMLIYENSDGDVNIIYNNPFYIGERHGITGNNDTLEMISQALQTISASGTSAN